LNEPTQPQFEANRANATQSTGPIGRSRAAQNARRHGLLSKHVVLSDESHADYKHLANSYLKQFQPQNAVEFKLVTALVTHYDVSRQDCETAATILRRAL